MENHALVVSRKDFDINIAAARGTTLPLVHWPVTSEQAQDLPSGYNFLAAQDNNHVLYSLPVQLRDRAIADDKINVDHQFLQLLPYVVFFHRRFVGFNEPQGSAPPTSKQEIRYFTYKRGDLGTEKRLHGNHSVGVGGHIETLPDVQVPLFRLIVEDSAREIDEEVGIKFVDNISNTRLESDSTEIVYSIEKLSDALNKAILFQDSTNNVGQAHLGIFMFVELPEMKVGALENNVVTDSAWLTIEELANIKLENWTSAALYLHSQVFLGAYKPDVLVSNFGQLLSGINDGTAS